MEVLIIQKLEIAGEDQEKVDTKDEKEVDGEEEEDEKVGGEEGWGDSSLVDDYEEEHSTVLNER